MNKEDIKVSVFGDTVTVRGERNRVESKEKKEGFQRVERYTGAFERSFSLDAELDPRGIKATYQDGVLEVSVPKAEVAKPRDMKSR